MTPDELLAEAIGFAEKAKLMRGIGDTHAAHAFMQMSLAALDEASAAETEADKA